MLKKCLKIIYITLCVAAVIVILPGVVSFHEYMSTKDYVERTGYIDDITWHTNLNNRGDGKEVCNYTIHWQSDGKSYEYRYKGSRTRPDDTVSSVWVSPDNSRAVDELPPFGIDTLIFFGKISLLLLIMSLVLMTIYFRIYPEEKYRNMSKNRKKEYRWNLEAACFLYSAFAFLGTIVMMIALFLGYRSKNRIEYETMDIGIFLLISAIVSVIIAVIISKKDKI